MGRTFKTPRGKMKWDCCAIGTFYWVQHEGKVIAIIGAQDEGCKQIMTEGYPWPLLIQGDWNVAWPLVEKTLAGELPAAPTGVFMRAHPEIYIVQNGAWGKGDRSPYLPKSAHDEHTWPQPVYTL